MKNLLFLLSFCLISLVTMAQQSSEDLITLKFKNSSWLPKKCTIISYTPGENGNGTQSDWLLPGGTKEWKFKEGTKLYLANQEQVDVVMGGERIDNKKPFLIVRKENRGKVIKF
jgi:hypothetical protein